MISKFLLNKSYREIGGGGGCFFKYLVFNLVYSLLIRILTKYQQTTEKPMSMS